MDQSDCTADSFDDTVRQLVGYCSSSVLRKPFESEWLVRRSLIAFRNTQLEQVDAAQRSGAAARQQAAQHHAAQQAQLHQEIGQLSMRRELESVVNGLRQSESHLEEQCQLQRQKLQHTEQLLAEAGSQSAARPKEEPLVIERYLRTALGNEKKALQDEKARNSNLLREQEKQWLQRMESLRKEEHQALQEKKLQVEIDVKHQRTILEEQLQELQVKLKGALEHSKQSESLAQSKLAAKDREWQERYARAQERAQERMLEIQVSEMEELQALNDANLQALQTKHAEELDATADQLRQAEAMYNSELHKAHAERNEVQERQEHQIAELVSSLARSRIADEDACLSSPTKKLRTHGPNEGQASNTPTTVRRRLVSKKRVIGAEKDQRITLAGPLTAKLQGEASSAPSTPAREMVKRSAAELSPT